MSDDPFLELAQELRAQVERAMADGDDVDAAFDQVARDERRRVTRAVFDALAPERQWEILAALFDDDVLRDALAEQHAARHDELARTAAARAAADEVRRTGRIELARVTPGTVVALGLFRPVDVRDALVTGMASTSCARHLVVRATGTEQVHVLGDVFNPERGLYVTAEYDERVWAGERLASHERVVLGSAGSAGFEPVLYLGGRVDTGSQPGRLHLGWLRFDDVPVTPDPP